LEGTIKELLKNDNFMRRSSHSFGSVLLLVSSKKSDGSPSKRTWSTFSISKTMVVKALTRLNKFLKKQFGKLFYSDWSIKRSRDFSSIRWASAKMS